jgi:hypothetical protein
MADTRTASAGIDIRAAKHRPDEVVCVNFTPLLFQFPDFLRDVSAK